MDDDAARCGWAVSLVTRAFVLRSMWNKNDTVIIIFLVRHCKENRNKATTSQALQRW